MTGMLTNENSQSMVWASNQEADVQYRAEQEAIRSLLMQLLEGAMDPATIIFTEVQFDRLLSMLTGLLTQTLATFGFDSTKSEIRNALALFATTWEKLHQEMQPELEQLEQKLHCPGLYQKLNPELTAIGKHLLEKKHDLEPGLPQLFEHLAQKFGMNPIELGLILSFSLGLSVAKALERPIGEPGQRPHFPPLMSQAMQKARDATAECEKLTGRITPHFPLPEQRRDGASEGLKL